MADMTLGYVDWAPYPNSVPTPAYYMTSSHVYVNPTDCSGDLHVFPCPRCKTCKCGKATLAEKG